MDAPESAGPRRQPPLPDDPTDDELARDWTLPESDRIGVSHCRGDANRLPFAIQLCALRTYGRFIASLIIVPVRIANHLAKQLALSPPLFVEPSSRPATDHRHHERICQHLGFRSFDGKTSRKLEERLVQLALCHQLKRYLPDFLDLPFEAEPGSESLLAAVELARRVHVRRRKGIPADAPMGFVPAGWRKTL